MSQAVIDSGSTKADWRIISNDGIISIRSSGYNPYQISAQKMESMIRDEVLPFISPLQLEKIFFYGAGCAAEEKKNLVKTVLEICFPAAIVMVETDLLGAARALLNKNTGLVAILGTGTNTGFYNGEVFIKQVESGGFILGDEGSGAYLGKLLLIGWLRKTFSREIEQKFEQFCPLTRDEIIDAIYNQPFPNRFIAGFSHFASENSEFPEIQYLISQSFEDFLFRIIAHYPKYESLPFHFAGSIASVFRKFLKKLLDQKNLQLGNIIESPINHLVTYHLEFSRSP